MLTKEINIRDPFIFVFGNQYYMYGTRGETAFAKKAFGLDVYISKDLENWSDPIEVFKKTDDFWGEKNFWAPEVYYYNDSFYMFATFAHKKIQKTIILKADKPDGLFKPWNETDITPIGWPTLDGTLYIQDDTPYMVFCREWKQVKDGQIWAVELDKELKNPVGEPFLLFKASEAKPFIKSFFFGRYITDGPYLIRTEDNKLHMLWSSMGKGGYVQLMAHSDTNDLSGKFKTDEVLYASDGGHGMIFKDLNNVYNLVLHSPNTFKKERPVFIKLNYKDGTFTKVKNFENEN